MPGTKDMINDLINKLDADGVERDTGKEEELEKNYGRVLERIGYGDETKSISRLLAGILSELDRKYPKKISE